jgi:hypothetical protein
VAPPGRLMNRSAARKELERTWNSPDEEERQRLRPYCCTEDPVFSHPHDDPTGVDGLTTSNAEFRRACPRATGLSGRRDEHDGRFRRSWITSFNAGRKDLEGVDFGEFGPDGRIRRMVSFSVPNPGVLQGSE